MITLFHIYYNQPHMVQLHLEAWRTHASPIHYAFVDDGSLMPLTVEHPGCTVYRVEKDIPWNMSGARNLGFHTAQTPWVMMGDIDHIVTADALNAILHLDMSDPNVVYTFRRQREDGVVGCHAVINVLMNRQRFFEMGGFDEDFSGHYGSEDTFFGRCLRHNGFRIVRCEQIVLQWHQWEGKTQGLGRNRRFNHRLINKKTQQLLEGKYRNGLIMRFPWKKQDSANPAAPSTQLPNRVVVPQPSASMVQMPV